MLRRHAWSTLLGLLACFPSYAFSASLKPTAKIVLVAGTPSHGKGEHEFNAGVQLLVGWLKKVKGVEAIYVPGGWPTDESVFEGATTVLFYLNGGSGHPLIQSKHRIDIVRGLLAKGAGFVCLHYAVEYPKGEFGDQLLEWLGGYYETGYSTNPTNETLVTPAPGHPITRGVPPFTCKDEWYYHIRFRSNDPRVTPILTTMLPKDNPNKETIAWATERADGGRSFGLTGGHFHTSWGVPEFRKLVLNAILWVSKLEVPKNGIESAVTAEELNKNLDSKP